ncbi:MAG: imidazole glycerol phosphate synthase subunit HisH [Planctomycetota bacterium]|nr:imidazole glycerol phosphate synthase subunit HisH [Planctomycetota bacterium]
MSAPIAIVDYGLGNLKSVLKAFAHLHAEAKLVEDPAELERAPAAVLPGVGAFGDGMAGLTARGLAEPLRAYAASGRPLLGICLGLQLFFERSAEAPGTAGLGLLPGEVRLFEGAGFGAQGGLKVPHMGWNALAFARPHPLFAGLDEGAYVYFVHSYYVAAARDEDVLARSAYGLTFCAAAGRGNVAGTQFHPEKSQKQGLRILSNFIAQTRTA